MRIILIILSLGFFTCTAQGAGDKCSKAFVGKYPEVIVETRYVETRHADGTVERRHSNGVFQIKSPDGRFVTRYPYDPLIAESYDGFFIPPWTQVETRHPDLRVVAEYSDGSVVTKHPNGQVVKEFSNGLVLTKHPNGEITIREPNGTVVTWHLDRRKVTKHPNGLKVTDYRENKFERIKLDH